jgi:hypothetical protein
MTPFLPANPLEKLLARAVAEPAARPEFCLAMMRHPLFVIREGPPPPPGQQQVFIGDECPPLEIKRVLIDGRTYVPVFTSEARIAETLAPGKKFGYVRMSGREVLTMLSRYDLVLNPQSACAMVFTAAEVRAILDGDAAEAGEGGVGEIVVGHPRDYPHHVIDALNRTLPSMRQVRATYVADVVMPGQTVRHTMIGMVVSGEWERVARQAGAAVQDVLKPGEIVDFVHLNGNGYEVVETFMRRRTKPFYRRRIFGIF